MANLVSNIDGVLEVWDDGTVNIVGGKLQIDSSDVLNNNNNASFADVRVDTLDFGDASPTLSDNGNFLRIQTSSGYTDIGADNTSFSHFYTDRDAFYFDKRIQVNSGEVRSHDEDLNLNRVGSTTARLRLTSGTTISDQDFSVTGDVTISGDLTVSGDTVTLNTTTITAEDAVILLNSGQSTPANDIGLIFQRYATSTNSNYNAAIIWEESTDKFIFGSTAESGTDTDITMAEDWMVINSSGRVGINIATPTEGQSGSVAPKLHVLGENTNYAFNLVARFQAGPDLNTSGAAILINHNNDRGLLIEAGRGGSGTAADDDAVSYLGLVDSGGTNTRLITLKQHTYAGTDNRYSVGIGTTEPEAKLDLYTNGIGAADTVVPDWSSTTSTEATQATGTYRDMIITNRHGASKHNVYGYATSTLEFRGTNTLHEWELGKIMGVVDPHGTTGNAGGLVFFASDGGSTDGSGRINRGTAARPYMSIGNDIIYANANVGIGITNPTQALEVSGNISVTGTVDGRDVATDGTKLDGIESGATADQTKADIDALNIDADTLDGLNSTSFLRSDTGDTATGKITFSGGHEAQAIFKSGATDFDSLKLSGAYSLYNANATGHTNAPFQYGAMITAGNTAEGGGMAMQIAHERTGTGTYIRGMNDTADTWYAWREIWTSGTDGSGSGLDADLLDGQQGTYYQTRTAIQDAPPSGVAGDLWYESDTGILFVYYGGAWIDSAPGIQTSDNLQIASLGVGQAASGTSGQIVCSSVGIGTNSPSTKLHIVDGNNIALLGDVNGNSTMSLRMSDSTASPVEVQAYSSSLKLRTTPSGGSMTDRVTIDADGDVGIGVAPYADSKVTIGGTVPSYSSVLMFDNNTTGGAEFFMLASDNTWSAGANKFLMGHGAPGSGNVDMTIDSSGQVGIGTYNPATKLHVAGAIYATGDVTAYYSDIRLKDVEGNIENALDKVNTLDGFYYTGNDTAKSLGYEKLEREVGVSAQQIEEVLPEAVANIPGNDEYKTVKYERIVPLLIESIKELDKKYQDKIDGLMKEIEALKDKG